MTALLGRSPLSASPIWNKPVDQIHPMQVQAYVDRLGLAGQRDIGETTITICIEELCHAVERGEIPVADMMLYTPPLRGLMGEVELREGLMYLGKEKGAAIIFALETCMSATQVGYLTWMMAMQMFRGQELSPLAILCTRVCPRQLHLQYVFWKTYPGLDVPAPLLSLDQDVFDAFGLVWAELERAYKTITTARQTAESLLG